MSHLRPAEIQMGAPRRHELLAVGGVVAMVVTAVALMAAGSLLSPDRSAERAVPAAAGNAATSAAATVGKSSAAMSPVPTSDVATTLAAIAGAWTGTIARPHSSGGTYGLDVTLMIPARCDRDPGACGYFRESTGGWDCVFTPWLLGADQGSNALRFEMVPDASHWQSCSAERVLITPLVDGRGIVVEEMPDAILTTPGRGVLTRSTDP